MNRAVGVDDIGAGERTQDERTSRICTWLSWILWLYWVALAWMACPFEDSVRDAIAALGIADGSAWPSTGPSLAGSVHVGPLWFYLLAPVAGLSHSWLGLSIFIAGIGALKFPLAYRLGVNLSDWRFGLLFAAALLLPGWQHLEAVLTTHTSVLETAVLAYLLVLRRYLLRPSVSLGFVVGGLFCLALHAHPTAIVLLALSAFCLWQHRHAGALRVRFASAMFAGALLPFLPYLIAQQACGWPDAGSASLYVGNSIGWHQLVNMPALAVAALWNGPHTLLDALTPASLRLPLFLLWAGVLSCSVLAMLPSWHRVDMRSRVLLLRMLAIWILTLCTLCFLRDRIPWYMCYLPELASAALIAAFWRCITSAWPRAERAVICAAVLCAGLGIALDAGLWRSTARGEFTLPGGAMHDTLAAYSPPESSSVIAGTSLAARFGSRSAAFLCAHPNAVLHGSYAGYVDDTAALDLRMACPEPVHLRIGGASDSNAHWIGLPRRVWREMQREPEFWIGPFGLASAQVLSATTASLAVATGERYPFRELIGLGDERFEIPFDAPATTTIVLSDVLRFIAPVRVDEVLAAGLPQAPVSETAFVRVYRCERCVQHSIVHWSVRFRAQRNDLLDVLGVDGLGTQ